MDDKLDVLIQLQREQNELLRRHLFRLRFSLSALLIVMTLLCVFFGITAYQATLRKWSSGIPATPAPAGATLNITGGEEGTSAPATTTDGVFRVFSNQDTLRLGTQSAPTDAPQFNLELAQPDANNDLFDTVIGEKK